VAYKPKRGRFAGYPRADFSTDSLKGWIDDVLGGGGEFVKFEGESLELKSTYGKDDL
jgi:hypothetical protein